MRFFTVVFSLLFIFVSVAFAGFGRETKRDLEGCVMVGYWVASPFEVYVACDDTADGREDTVLLVTPGRDEWKVVMEYTPAEVEALYRCYYGGDCADFNALVGVE